MTVPGDEEADIDEFLPYTYEDYLDDNEYEYHDEHPVDEKLPPYQEAEVFQRWS